MSKCFVCQNQLPEGERGLLSCPKCGQAQVVTPANAFEVLGAPLRFDLELHAMENRYYQLSRTLHPDRFGAAATEIKEAARRNSAEVNTAYDTLKAPESRIDALLEIAGGTTKDAAIPQDWAERFFELEETEDTSLFLRDLTQEIQASENKLLKLAAKIDWTRAASTQPASVEVTELGATVKRLAYLRSLQRQLRGDARL